MPTAREINTEAFANAWSRYSRLKGRFQYNLEGARKAFLYALDSVGIAREHQAVLDVGFGNGMLLFCFGQSCTLMGTEFSKTAIADVSREAKARGYRSPRFVEPTDSEVLPFDSQSCDVVIASHVVEHVEHDTEFIRELLRVVRPSGVVIILCPLDHPGSGLLSEEALRNPGFAEGHYHVRNYNEDSLMARAKSAGGNVVYSKADMHVWNWKVRQDTWRLRLKALPVVGHLDAVLSLLLNLPLTLLPAPALRTIDRWFHSLGHPPRQLTMVLRPGGRS